MLFRQAGAVDLLNGVIDVIGHETDGEFPGAVIPDDILGLIVPVTGLPYAADIDQVFFMGGQSDGSLVQGFGFDRFAVGFNDQEFMGVADKYQPFRQLV